MRLKNQGSILYLLGYLVYVCSRPALGKIFIWIICLALISFGISLLASLSYQKTEDQFTIRIKKRLETTADSAGGLFTLLFALTFIPKAHFIETHLALFGLLILTFLATRNILPGVSEQNHDTENDIDHPSAVGLPINK